MALKVGDRVKQTSTTTGTGTITLNGAAPTGFSNFRDYLSDGDTTYYVIEDGTNYEIGLGTFNTGGSATADTIARASDANVYRSTNSNNRVNWSSGTRSVFISEPSDKAVFLDGSGDLNLTGALSLIDSGSGGILNIGNSSDLQIYHNGSNTIFNNQTGNFFLIQGSDDADLYLSCDDQQGGTTSYIWLDGSEGEVKLRHAASGSASTKLTTKSTGVDVNGTVTATTFSGGLASDNLTVGDSAVTLSTTSGNITIDADGNDTDIIFKGTDGGLGRTYLTIDGSDAGTAQFSHDIKLYDDGLLRLGHNSDLEIGHIITESIISNYTVDLNITNYANDKDISILTDDGSGGTALYFKADGSTGETLLYHYGSEKLATKSTGVDVTGTITADVLTVAADTDATTTLGRALIHSPASDGAAFSHVDKTALTDYALFQSANGTTYINASSGTNINFNNNNSNIAYISSTGLRLGAGKDLMFEGATGDNFETFVTVTDPTADRTITLPDATGTVLINASNQSITGDLTLISTASGNGDGPALTLKRDNTPTGNFFNQGHIEFLGENQSGTEIKYGEIKVQASTTSAGNE